MVKDVLSIEMVGTGTLLTRRTGAGFGFISTISQAPAIVLLGGVISIDLTSAFHSNCSMYFHYDNSTNFAVALQVGTQINSGDFLGALLVVVVVVAAAAAAVGGLGLQSPTTPHTGTAGYPPVRRAPHAQFRLPGLQSASCPACRLLSKRLFTSYSTWRSSGASTSMPICLLELAGGAPP